MENRSTVVSTMVHPTCNMSKRKRSTDNKISMLSKFEETKLSTDNTASLFSSSWTKMDKPIILRPLDAYDADQMGGDIVGYNNLFADYAVASENPKEESKVEISAADECRRSYVNLTELTSDDYEPPSKKPSCCDLDGAKTRHERNGAFTFRQNGEYEMMLHVQRGLGDLNIASFGEVQSANSILAAVDEYCTEEQWMYHIGREKGEALKDFMSECIDMHKSSQRRNRRLVIVDVGTYCGYSAILLAKSVMELDPELDFHVYTTEISTQNIMVASSMILMAKLQPYITVLPFQPSVESLSNLLRTKKIMQIDFLFLDHAKDMYLEDLQQLERNGFIKKGSHVAADNVVFNRLDGYRNHVMKLANRFVTETRLAQVKLEYSDDIKDGIGASTLLYFACFVFFVVLLTDTIVYKMIVLFFQN